MRDFAFNFESKLIGSSRIIHADCFEWLVKVPENSLHAIVTDPPYGVKEYDFDQLEKRANGNGGIWRIPPSFDGHTRAPLPRFTALDSRERKRLREFFVEWAKLASRALRPGAHVFIATNAFPSWWRPSKERREDFSRCVFLAAWLLRALGHLSQAAPVEDESQ